MKATGGNGAYKLKDGEWCEGTNIPTIVNPGTGFQVQMRNSHVVDWAQGGLSFFVYDINTGVQILDGEKNSLQYVVRNTHRKVEALDTHKCQFEHCPPDGQDYCLLNMMSPHNPELTDIRGTLGNGNNGYGCYKSGCRGNCDNDFNVVLYWKDNSSREDN